MLNSEHSPQSHILSSVAAVDVELSVVTTDVIRLGASDVITATMTLTNNNNATARLDAVAVPPGGFETDNFEILFIMSDGASVESATMFVEPTVNIVSGNPNSGIEAGTPLVLTYEMSVRNRSGVIVTHACT